ncbi:pseudouridine synthase [Clostridium sp. DL1XJH146]
MIERLQKYIAHCGISSRRKAENLILEGRVKVNDVLINELGTKIDTDIDKVYVDNKLIKPETKKIYIALNKPTGYITTANDEKGRKTVIDLIDIEERIYPIGRLDANTSGILLLTNDGEVFNKVIHPRSHIKKTYICEVNGIPSKENMRILAEGVDIGGYITQKATATILKKTKEENAILKITISEGKNRQVRKMCLAIGHNVITLKRISVGNIKLNNLIYGKWRYLDAKEIEYLMNL